MSNENTKSKYNKRLSPEDFEFIALAGRGGFGNVWVVRKKNDFCGKVMAMKITNKNEMKARSYAEHTVLEKQIMASIRHHPFIVDLYFTFQTTNNVYIVMEYLPGGHLLSYVLENDEAWPENYCQFYGAEILLALQHMHNRNVVYRDLKLENVLLDIDGHIRITDFGLSFQLKNDQERVYSMSGTAAYIAPEILEENGEKGHGKSVDIWAYGVLMFILLLHESPFYSENTYELFEKIQKQEIDWELYRPELSPSALSLLQGLLTKKVEDRLGCGASGIQEIMLHPFFSSINWDDILQMKVTPFIKPKLRVAERANDKDRLDQMDPTADVVNNDIFSGFSFVADHYLHLLENKDNVRSFHRSEELICWPHPVVALPISVVQRILGYLKISDIVHLSSVCKDWNAFIWCNLRSIDLSSLSSSICDKHFISSISKILSKTTKLTYLRLHPSLKDTFVSNIPQIGGLRSLSFQNCTHLTPIAIQRLYFSVGFSKSDDQRKITQRFPSLQRLDLSYCINLGDTALEFLAGFSSLTHLRLSGMSNVTDVGIRSLLCIKTLEVLELHGLSKLTDAGIMQLTSLPKLWHVNFSGCVLLSKLVVGELSKKIDQVIWIATPFDDQKHPLIPFSDRMFSKDNSLLSLNGNNDGNGDPTTPRSKKAKTIALNNNNNNNDDSSSHVIHNNNINMIHISKTISSNTSTSTPKKKITISSLLKPKTKK